MSSRRFADFCALSVLALKLSVYFTPPPPPQARMDLEPLVRLASRALPVDPLTSLLPRLTHIVLECSSFTRDPWCLGELLLMGGSLTRLEISWDTALWAPGQNMQEWEALQVGFRV